MRVFYHELASYPGMIDYIHVRMYHRFPPRTLQVRCVWVLGLGGLIRSSAHVRHHERMISHQFPPNFQPGLPAKALPPIQIPSTRTDLTVRSTNTVLAILDQMLIRDQKFHEKNSLAQNGPDERRMAPHPLATRVFPGGFSPNLVRTRTVP